MKKMLFICTRIIVLSYLGTCALLYFVQDKILYYPSKNEEIINWLAKDTEVKTFRLPTDEGNTYARATGTGNCLVFYIGGNAEDTDYYFVLDRDWGNNCVFSSMNYRGFGASDGKANEKNMKEDSTALLRAIYNEYKPEKLYIVGRSLGTNIASYLATSGGIKADKLVLITPYDSVENVAEEHYWYIPVGWLIHDAFDSTELVKNVTIPTLIIRASEDTTIPPRFTTSLIQNFEKTIPKEVVIANTDHNTVDGPRAFRESIDSFLSD